MSPSFVYEYAFILVRDAGVPVGTTYSQTQGDGVSFTVWASPDDPRSDEEIIELVRSVTR